MIDGKTRIEISKLYTKKQASKRKTCYYLQKFEYHLHINFNISIKQYCKDYLNISWPKCPIGKEVGFQFSGKGLLLSTYSRGGINKDNCKSFAESCEKLSIDRAGEGNPMFGKVPWNQGLTKYTDISVMKTSDSLTGRKQSDETREKSRASMKKRLEGGERLHTAPHSEETKEKLRIKTASMWSRGAFPRVTSIHLKMREFLNSLEFKYDLKEEFQVKYFSMDFAFPEIKVAIECQGTYFHIDPRIYPNGPQDAIQRRNFGRDKAKQKICCGQEGWNVIEVWETEINDGSFKEYIKCKLLELKVLKN